MLEWRLGTGELGEEGRLVEEGSQEDHMATTNGVDVVDEEVGEAVLKALPFDLTREEQPLAAREGQNFFGQLLHIGAVEKHHPLGLRYGEPHGLARIFPTLSQPLHLLFFLVK